MTEAQRGSFSIRSAEPDDYEAVRQIFSGPKVVWGTLQLPFPTTERWRHRMSEPQEGAHTLLACTEDEVLGQLGLYTFPSHPRRRHAGQIVMAVRDDWQGKGVGTALMEAAIDLADNWLNLTRLELDVFVDNEPGIRLYRHFGFVVEGTAKSYAYRDGRFADVLHMARLRSQSQ
jgi:putative acetyltransferase